MLRMVGLVRRRRGGLLGLVAGHEPLEEEPLALRDGPAIQLVERGASEHQPLLGLALRQHRVGLETQLGEERQPREHA